MTEEKITLKIIEWLKNMDWKIICFDFPQSGTGITLHPNDEFRDKKTKNKSGIIPDIVAYKNGIVVFFENKNRFYYDDFVKVKELKDNNNYTRSIEKLLSSYAVDRIFYGIGILNKQKDLEKAVQLQEWIDFIVSVSIDNEVSIIIDQQNLF